MKRLLSHSTAFACFIVCMCHKSYAGSGPSSGRPAIDSVSPKAVSKLSITVRDREDGSYLDSVYVAIGTKKGYTNSNGYIEFDSVKPGYEVVISKSGYYSQSKKVKPVLQFRLSRKEGQASISTVNNGLYERPAEHFSGSALVVSGNELRKVNSLDFTEALKYYAPSFIVNRDNRYGDNPNVTPEIKIRGSYNFPVAATIAAHPGITSTGVQVNPSSGDFIADNIVNPNQPAFFVNGVQVALQSALDIDINRIEKVTILKDASATALYGVRGGHGAVLIETTRPKEGKMNIRYSGQVQVSEADLSSYQSMNAQEKLAFEQENGFYASNENLFKDRQDRINKGAQTDWLHLPLRQAIGTKHSIAADGGNEDTRYGLDFTYNDVEGAMIGTSRKTSSFGAYISTRVKNVLFSNHLTFSKTSAANSPYGSFDSYTWQNAYWSPYDSISGKMAKLLEEVTFDNSVYKIYNPGYNGTISTKDAREYTRLANTANLTWDMGRGFKLNGLAAYHRQADQVDQFLPPGHLAFAEYSPADFFKRGQYNQINSTFTNIEAALRLNYNKKIGLHQLYASAGGAANQTESEATGLVVAGFTSDKLTDLAFGSAYATTQPQTGKVVTRLASGFGNLTYSFDNRYQVEFTGNADAASQFGKNEPVAPHWSAGASWNLHQERFFHANKIVDQFRIRASAGTAGDHSFLSYLGHASYRYFTDKQYIKAGSTLNDRGIGLGAFLTGIANENLKVPEVYKENIGLDAVLLQNRLAISVEAYRQKVTDIILPLASPAYTGFQDFSYYDNLGAIENKGIEFSLKYNIIRNTQKSIYWNVLFNGLHNEDRIVATSNYVDKINDANDAADQTRPQPRYVAGESLTGIWAVRSLGIDAGTGKELYVRPDGRLTYNWSAADKIVAGDMTPNWQGSFGSSVSIKNITAGVYFNYQFDVQGYNQTLADKVENASMLYNADVRAASGRWKQTGDMAPFKPVSPDGLQTSPTYATSRFVQENDFVNCSAVSLGYTLPQSLAGKIRAQDLKIGLMGNNLFHWQAMKAERGIYYPFQRQYSFSISSTF